MESSWTFAFGVGEEYVTVMCLAEGGGLHTFETSLGYVVSSKPTWVIE